LDDWFLSTNTSNLEIFINKVRPKIKTTIIFLKSNSPYYNYGSPLLENAACYALIKVAFNETTFFRRSKWAKDKLTFDIKMLPLFDPGTSFSFLYVSH
jgi:hypothetical protein